MTTIRKLFGDAVGFGERHCLDLRTDDGDLVAQNPNENCPVEILVSEGLDELSEKPPGHPVYVEIQREFVGDRVVGRVISATCPDEEQTP
ncbi:hypothetical protein [Halovivax gelatinilyticus]|uniref:hypothetical protein n=1 Tax=Halovivax gelatinilyticus TaxID=2961597 RepID=UPI0020CA6564|nr:hypothetical protein [Halovivax gelatinilyticus]